MSKRIRVLFAIGALGGGGSERQMIGILKYLDRSVFEPFLFLIYREGPLLKDIPEDVPTFAFWDHHRPPRWNYPGRILRMQEKYLSEILEEQNIQALYTRTYQMALVAYGAAKGNQVPWITVEVADPKLAIEKNTDRFLRMKRRRLGKAYRVADKVAGVSDGVRQGIVDYYGLSPERVSTLYNFVDIDRIDRLSNEPIPNWSSGRFHIAAAGRLYEQKGYTYLLHAVKKLTQQHNKKQILLHILGEGPLEKELKRYVAENDLQHHVNFEGFTQNPTPFFKGADLFCLASLYEGMPNSLMEAMACQAPILSTDCPSGPREILQDGRYGRLVAPADSEALANGILDAIENHDQWKAIVPNARKYLEENFSPAIGIERLENLLRDVCKDS